MTRPPRATRPSRRGRVIAEPLLGDAVVRIAFDAPPGNILDIPMMDDLTRALRRAARAPALKVILFEGEGPNFSYGASIEDHRPARVGRMLRSFHALFRALARIDRVLVAVVRGRCLGGGMELACFCHRVFADPGARLAQPEIDLGVFPPVASLILARRAGQPVADEVCLTGRSFTAAEALEAGLVDEVAADPRRAAEEWLRASIIPKSAAAIRLAVRAARLRWNDDFLKNLARVERLYLRDLMRTADAREGIEAFLAKRPPVWKDR
jgi:cyclohexa-1,5-dienecarbonyl-CoA hydratase